MSPIEINQNFFLYSMYNIMSQDFVKIYKWEDFTIPEDYYNSIKKYVDTVLGIDSVLQGHIIYENN